MRFMDPGSFLLELQQMQSNSQTHGSLWVTTKRTYKTTTYESDRKVTKGNREGMSPVVLVRATNGKKKIRIFIRPIEVQKFFKKMNLILKSFIPSENQSPPSDNKNSKPSKSKKI